MGCNLFSMVIYKMPEMGDTFRGLGDLPTGPARGPEVTMNMGMDPREFGMGSGARLPRTPSTNFRELEAVDDMTERFNYSTDYPDEERIFMENQGGIDSGEMDPSVQREYLEKMGLYQGPMESNYNVPFYMQNMQRGKMYRAGYKRRRSSKRRSSKRRSSKRRSSKRRPSKRRPSKRRPSKKKKSTRRRKPTRK